VNLGAIESEMADLKKRLKNCDQRRSNLLQALELGEFEADEVLDRINNLKRVRREDEARLSDLQKTRDNLTSLADAKIKLHELYGRVMDNLENATQEIKELALDALDIKVYASTDKVEIQGVIPLKLALPTTGQTSGCRLIHNGMCSENEHRGCLTAAPQCRDRICFLQVAMPPPPARGRKIETGQRFTMIQRLISIDDTMLIL
jgi:hypothetical protein